jgi:hypothetical protein
MQIPRRMRLECGPQEVSVKEIHTPRSCLALALTLTIFCGVVSARQHLPNGLVLEKPSVDLGTLVIGNSTVVTETIFNPTNSDISIAAVSVDNPAFQISSTNSPLVIGSRQQVSIGITFAPAAAGQISGSLILSLDGNTPYATIPLYGVAVRIGQLSANPPSISLGGGAGAQSIVETLTNSGGTILTITSATVSGGGFAISGPPFPILLRPNQTTSFNVSIPSSAKGPASGSINVAAGVAWWTLGGLGIHQYATEKATRTHLVIPVSVATAVGQLTPAPSSVSFGSVQVGNKQTQSATLTNSGNGPVTVTQAAATGTGFSVSGLPLPMTLNPGESATFSAVFTPQSTGSAQGNLSIVSNASNSTLNLALSGSGASSGQLILSPASLNFGSVPVGKNQSMTATLAATGSSVTVSSASASTQEFSLSGIQLPITIPAGKTASFTVKFAPQATGTTSASIAFGSNASPSTSVESVSGAGSAPASHSVGLSWSPGSSNVSGYNVYRGSQSGGPYAKINSAPTAATAFGDGSVNSGQTYFYVTTALDSSGGESSNSNEVQAVIP